MFGGNKKKSYLCTVKKQAGVAQLVERQPSKLNVASSNLVSRSFFHNDFFSAGVAQLVERQPSKLNVASSNLVSRSRKYPSPILRRGILLYLLYGNLLIDKD